MVDKNIKLEKIDINSLVPADYNPRKISEKDYKNLKNSINEFGVVDPIIVNLKDNTIIGGHQRFDVLFYENNIQELHLLRLGDIGWVFPDTDLKIKDKNHEKTLNLALNRVHGEWDEDLLSNVLVELEELNLDHLTGFDLEFDDINYDFISRLDDEEDDSEDYYEDDDILEDEEFSEEEIQQYIEEETTEYVEEDVFEEPIKENETSKDRVRRGFVKYGDIYKIGDSTLLMFGKYDNEQDRTKLLNTNIQKNPIKLSEDIKKVKTVNKEIEYYISDDAELIENTIIANNKICKKIK